MQLARDTTTGQTVAIKFVERNHPSLAGGLLLREISNQVRIVSTPATLVRPYACLLQLDSDALLSFCPVV